MVHKNVINYERDHKNYLQGAKLDFCFQRLIHNLCSDVNSNVALPNMFH